VLIVEDDGPASAPATADVFEKLSAEAREQCSGGRLGLAICRAIAVAARQAKSMLFIVHRGARFEGLCCVVPGTTSIQVRAILNDPGNAHRILVVDEDPRPARRILRTAWFERTAFVSSQPYL